MGQRVAAEDTDPGHRERTDGLRSLREAVRPAVAGSLGRFPHGRIVSTTRVGERCDAAPEEVLEEVAAPAKIVLALRRCQRRQVGVHGAVRTEVDPLARHGTNLIERQRAQRERRGRVDPVDRARTVRERVRHEEDGGRDAMAQEDRQRVVEQPGKPIVEGQ